jgi:hypothetical protein
MKAKWLGGLALALLILALGAMLGSRGGSAQGQPPGGRPGMPGGARYTVVDTEGHNLLVTDNAANQLYYYTTDKDAPVGSPLKLRASLDLTQVGKPEIRLTPHNLENVPKKNERERR